MEENDCIPEPTFVDAPSSAISELIAKLEGAAEGSRGLDVFFAQVADKPTTLLGGRMFDDAIRDFPHELATIANHWPVAPYTTSVDAILALIERELPGWRWSAGNDWYDEQCWARVFPAPREQHKGTGNQCAATPALALCIAFLKARSMAQPRAPQDDGDSSRDEQSLRGA